MNAAGMTVTTGGAMGALHWPRTLFARLALILCVGLVLAQVLSFTLTLTERDDATAHMMTNYISREVAISVALLDHLPAADRPMWLPQLARRSYSFILGPGTQEGGPVESSRAKHMEDSVTGGLGANYAITSNAVADQRDHLQIHLRLSDGSPLTIDARPASAIPLSGWLPAVLLMQLVVLAACCWFAVRLATRPLKELARVAEALGPDLKAERLAEDGPSEVARAGRAFNAMQDRIAAHMAERMQILAAISHDLQTPITRMRLRVDQMEDGDALAPKLVQDLREMEQLVKEGVTYARTLHGTAEAPRRVDLDALLDSLVCDYIDAGSPVTYEERRPVAVVTRVQALRRIVGNLVDNALKYGGSASIEVNPSADGRAVTISVFDRGPGIPGDALERVFEPFYRVETSRNRGTGGTGLGLAIARQLAIAMGAQLSLHNRPEGGLEGRLVLNAAPDA
jgi:signal transduction histidine kinase